MAYGSVEILFNGVFLVSVLKYIFFVRTIMDEVKFDDADPNFRFPNSLRAKLQKDIMFGSILQLQTILSGTKEMEARIPSFFYFYENGIVFNVANSTSFVSMIVKSIKFA